MTVSNDIVLPGDNGAVDDVLDEVLGKDEGAGGAEPADKKVEATEPDEKPAREFAAINSQEEFNARVQKRIERERAKFKDYEDLKTKAAEFDKLEAEKGSDIEKANRRAEKAEKDLAELQKTIAKRDRDDLVREIGDELGLPAKLRARVQGDDDKAIRADIEDLLEGLPKQEKPADKQGPPSNSPKEKIKLANQGGEPPEISSDDIVKSIDRGGLRF